MSKSLTSAEAESPRKPTPKQVYFIAHLALNALDVTWPATIADVQPVIEELRRKADANN